MTQNTNKLKELKGILKGHKDTKGKLKLNLVPPRAYESIALVREFGCNKYGDPWGWLEHVKEEDLREACKRHLLRIEMGETHDPESNLLHLEHALCSLAMAIEIIKRK
jgi:hypothetical protein